MPVSASTIMRLGVVIVVGLAAFGATGSRLAQAREVRAPGRVVLLGADRVWAPVATGRPDGSVMLAGFDRRQRPVLIRLKEDGSVDRRFRRRRLDVDVSGGPLLSLLPRPEGLLLVGGWNETVLIALTA